MYDCCFTNENNWFRYRAAAIIVEDGCVLLAGNEEENYLYSVGGGVHMNENYYMMKPKGKKELFSDSYTRFNVKESMHWIPINELDKHKHFPDFLQDFLCNYDPDAGVVHIVSDERKQQG